MLVYAESQDQQVDQVLEWNPEAKEDYLQNRHCQIYEQ